jgi:hypothetical protein
MVGIGDRDAQNVRFRSLRAEISAQGFCGGGLKE